MAVYKPIQYNFILVYTSFRLDKGTVMPSANVLASKANHCYKKKLNIKRWYKIVIDFF